MDEIVINNAEMSLMIRIVSDEVKRCGEPEVVALLDKLYDIAEMEDNDG